MNGNNDRVFRVDCNKRRVVDGPSDYGYPQQPPRRYDNRGYNNSDPATDNFEKYSEDSRKVFTAIKGLADMQEISPNKAAKIITLELKRVYLECAVGYMEETHRKLDDLLFDSVTELIEFVVNYYEDITYLNEGNRPTIDNIKDLIIRLAEDSERIIRMRSFNRRLFVKYVNMLFSIFQTKSE